MKQKIYKLGKNRIVNCRHQSQVNYKVKDYYLGNLLEIFQKGKN